MTAENNGLEAFNALKIIPTTRGLRDKRMQVVKNELRGLLNSFNDFLLGSACTR